jgi:uncharacterized protein YjbI with pentapeptide repeats
LKAARFSAADLKIGGFTATELKAARFSAADLKIVGFTATELKAATFSAADLKIGGFTATELKAATFTVADLKTGGFSAAELKAEFTVDELKDGGYGVRDLRGAEYTQEQILFHFQDDFQVLDLSHIYRCLYTELLYCCLQLCDMGRRNACYPSRTIVRSNNRIYT